MKHNVCVYYEGRFHNDQNHILEKKSFGSGIKKKVDQPLTQAFRCDKGKVPTFN